MRMTAYGSKTSGLFRKKYFCAATVGTLRPPSYRIMSHGMPKTTTESKMVNGKTMGGYLITMEYGP